MMFIYTLHVGKLPLIIGAFFSLPVCIRNLMLIYKERRVNATRDLLASPKFTSAVDQKAQSQGAGGQRPPKPEVAEIAR